MKKPKLLSRQIMDADKHAQQRQQWVPATPHAPVAGGDDTTASFTVIPQTDRGGLVGHGSRALVHLKLDDVGLNPANPRRYPLGLAESQIDELLGIPELAASIQRDGLLQPIGVIKNRGQGQEYLVLVGERRYRAHKFLKRNTIDAVLRKPTLGEEDTAELAAMIAENVERRDLTPMQIALAADALRTQLPDAVARSRALSWNEAQTAIQHRFKLSRYDFDGIRRLAQLADEAQEALLMHDGCTAGEWYQRLRQLNLESADSGPMALDVVQRFVATDQAAMIARKEGRKPIETEEAPHTSAASHSATSKSEPAARGAKRAWKAVELFSETLPKAVGRPEVDVSIRVRREAPADRSEKKKLQERKKVLDAALDSLSDAVAKVEVALKDLEG